MLRTACKLVSDFRHGVEKTGEYRSRTGFIESPRIVRIVDVNTLNSGRLPSLRNHRSSQIKWDISGDRAELLLG